MIHRSSLPPVDTINPLYNAIELAHQLRDADARVLVTAPRSIDTALRAAKSAGVKDVYVLGRSDGAVPLPRRDTPQAGKP